MTIWIVTKLTDSSYVDTVRAFYTADAAKAYINTLPVEDWVEYDWESVELEGKPSE